MQRSDSKRERTPYEKLCQPLWNLYHLGKARLNYWPTVTIHALSFAVNETLARVEEGLLGEEDSGRVAGVERWPDA